MIQLLILQLFFNDSGVNYFLIIQSLELKRIIIKKYFYFLTIYDILKIDILFI